MKSSLVSVTIHLGLVGLVVLITPGVGSTHQRPPERPPILIWNPPRTTGTGSPDGGGFGGPTEHFVVGPVPRFDDGSVPPPIDSKGWNAGPLMPAADTAWDGRATRDDGGRRTSSVLSADVVDVQVTPYPNAPTPRYPEALREAGIEGEVVLEFVVDTTGRVDRESVRVLSTPSDAFVVSVRDALAATRYHPALVGGQRVRQLVRQGFVFSLTQR